MTDLLNRLLILGMKLIDLTHSIENNMQVYPGDRPPSLVQTHHINKDQYTDHQLTCGMHTGTHIDGAWHMTDNSRFIDNEPLESFFGKACVIDIRNYTTFNNVDLLKKKAVGCSIVLFYTGFGKHFGSDKYPKDYPLLDISIAKQLKILNIKLIGIDSLSPDTKPYETHKYLLSNGVLIAENLTNLHLLPTDKHFEIIALPLKIKADSAPARIVALLED